MALVRDSLREWMREIGVEDRLGSEILVAAGEACANVLEHSGARPTTDEPAGWIQASLHEGVLRIVVADRGQWIDRDPKAFSRRNRGRGRLLMAGLMDDFALETGTSGTTVTMSKALYGRPPGDVTKCRGAVS